MDDDLFDINTGQVRPPRRLTAREREHTPSVFRRMQHAICNERLEMALSFARGVGINPGGRIDMVTQYGGRNGYYAFSIQIPEAFRDATTAPGHHLRIEGLACCRADIQYRGWVQYFDKFYPGHPLKYERRTFDEAES